MQGLLLRLSTLDAAAENAVRVISFFDSLAETVPDVETLLSHAAILTETDLGIVDEGKGIDLIASPNQRVRVSAASAHAQRRRIDSQHEAWISRKGPSHPLDDIVLERLALASAAVMVRVGQPKVLEFDDPALLELAISPSAAVVDRARALHLLGTPPAAKIVVIAAHGPDVEVGKTVEDLRSSGAWVRHTNLSEISLMVASAEAVAEMTVMPGTRVGISSPCAALEAPRSWPQALCALRFAEKGTYRSISADGLGAFELLASQLRSSDITGVPDIDVLNDLRAARGGAEMLNTLEVLVTAGSMREAARQLNLHHNSVAARVAKAEEALGFRISDPGGLVRIALALALRQLARHDMLA